MNKKYKRIIQLLIICMLFQINVTIINAKEVNSKNVITNEQLNEIKDFIKKQQGDAKIPGMSVVICNDQDIILEQGYGYSDVEKKSKVTSDTYFELGSNSKAFTGLAIRKLEDEGKISLDDSVTKYIPWLKLRYEGDNQYYDITLRQLLFHTSGIPFNSIGYIQADKSEDAIEHTVKTLLSQKLENLPGKKFLYATINYDVLGLVIEKVTNMPYEQYMREHIFKRLGLNNTCFLSDVTGNLDVATGYKISFLGVKEYVAPTYKGNAPAGYICMNTVDLVKWMQINMENGRPTELSKLMSITHEADRSVQPESNGLTSYGSGWNVYQSGSGKIGHGGNNPNYSSYIIIRTKDKIGVGVLANMNSEFTTIIANGIMDIIEGEELDYVYKDTYQTLDTILTLLSIVCSVITVIILYLIVKLILDIIKHKRTLTKKIRTVIIRDIILCSFIGFFGYCVYLLPDALYSELPWNFILVWGPFTLIPSFIMLFLCILMLFVYYNIIAFFPGDKEKYTFLLIILSIVSGLGNSVIIFTVNQALASSSDFSLSLFVYCLLGIVLYVLGQKIVRTKMIKITNEYVYDMRMGIVNEILDSTYSNFEKLSNGNINAIINGDIQVMSNSPNIIIAMITNMGTLLCCFVYLGIIDIRALLVSIIIISIAVIAYLMIGRRNNILWEETRSLQDVFFDYVNDMILGFKQLKLNARKKKEFKVDIENNCSNYTNKNREASVNFTNVFVVGELVFTAVIVSVAFLFPYIFPDIQDTTLKTYVFVFLFMTGPLSGVMNSVPEIMRTKVSYKRIRDFQNELLNYKEKECAYVVNNDKEIHMQIMDLKYEYKNVLDKKFQIGPINCEFNSGEIIFITGGNGSGKTTLLKLLIGLYQPDSGEIRMNGEVMNENIGEYYSNVLTDFYLFKKLYGIDYQNKLDKINEFLKLLKIDDKLEVKDGEFSTLNLSTGQKKRVALMISYLEDKPIYIFDEWASDQDPQFRKFFYEELIFDLKKNGKCVIAITHDDRYFHLADKILKMEFGNLEYYKINKRGEKNEI